jgi:hypothetical protein
MCGYETPAMKKKRLMYCNKTRKHDNKEEKFLVHIFPRDPYDWIVADYLLYWNNELLFTFPTLLKISKTCTT